MKLPPKLQLHHVKGVEQCVRRQECRAERARVQAAAVELLLPFLPPSQDPRVRQAGQHLRLGVCGV